MSLIVAVTATLLFAVAFLAGARAAVSHRDAVQFIKYKRPELWESLHPEGDYAAKTFNGLGLKVRGRHLNSFLKVDYLEVRDAEVRDLCTRAQKRYRELLYAFGFVALSLLVFTLAAIAVQGFAV